MKFLKWIGVDFDKTLVDEEGQSYPKMVELVNHLLSEGKYVKIFTARAKGDYNLDEIKDFCKEHFGMVLPITNEKDPGMEVLYDDRAIQVKDGEPMLQGIGQLGGALKERVVGPKSIGKSRFGKAISKLRDRSNGKNGKKRRNFLSEQIEAYER